MSANTGLASAPICSDEDLNRTMHELAEHEGRAAAVRKALTDYMVNKELDDAAESSRRRNYDPRNIAGAAGVNYMALHSFVISDEAHAFAYEFIHGSDLRKYTREVLHQLRETQERLRWLQAEAAHGRYGENSDLNPWMGDEAGFDKRHFVTVDYITRFVLLCKNFRPRSSKDEWVSERFGCLEARLEMYKGILLLFLKKEED
ncbi:hypothetical protein DL771_008927 [Monosporascus sp. 5C6A]|nr:hypothetical protein DL771_008927 [Monosporascus sp. 5C6A]